MGAFIGFPTGMHVKRTGDIMTGDLNLGLNSLILTDGVDGGILRGLGGSRTHYMFMILTM